MQVCSDGESLCSSQSECSVCGSDGSAVLFTATDPQRTYEYLEVAPPPPPTAAACWGTPLTLM